MNEKKKVMILAALFVVVIAVGAFQFMGSSTPPPAATTTADATDETVTTDGSEPTDDAALTEGAEGDEPEGFNGSETAVLDENGQPVAPLVFDASGRQIVALMARDPFKAPGGVDETTVQAPPTNTAPVERPKPVKRDPMPGYVPLDPGNFGPLPGAGLTQAEEPEPSFRVTGVLVGVKPIAVFEDDKGNQRLVPLGGSVDGDTKVTGIERGKVTVSRRGKETTLVIQEEARNDN